MEGWQEYEEYVWQPSLFLAATGGKDEAGEEHETNAAGICLRFNAAGIVRTLILELDISKIFNNHKKSRHKNKIILKNR